MRNEGFGVRRIARDSQGKTGAGSSQVVKFKSRKCGWTRCGDSRLARESVKRATKKNDDAKLQCTPPFHIPDGISGMFFSLISLDILAKVVRGGLYRQQHTIFLASNFLISTIVRRIQFILIRSCGPKYNPQRSKFVR